MPILDGFEYHRPGTFEEALELLEKFKGRAAILNGGTDLVVELKDGRKKPDVVVDIKAIAGLDGITIEKGRALIGAGVTFGAIIQSKELEKRLPLVVEAARTVGSSGLRNRATMVGNICSAVPCLDSGPVLLVLDADVIVRSRRGEHKIPVGRWFLGPRKTALKPGELVTAVSIPFEKKIRGSCFMKLGRYAGEDLAQASVAIAAMRGAKYRIAFGAVGPVPLRAKKIEAFLAGKKLSEKVFSEAAKRVDREISPITDIRASKEYRLHMCRIMLERGLKKAVGLK